MKMCVGLRQQLGVFALHFAEDAHAQARARERMAIHHLARQAELDAEAAHFVLEQLAQRLDQAELHVSGRPPTLWWLLMTCALPVLLPADSITSGIDRALRQPLRIGELVRLLVEDLDEQVADDLALGFRIADAFERVEIAIGGVDADHLDAHVLGEHRHHLVAFVPAQQAGVDEHAGQLVADRLVQQRRDDRGIHAARQAEDHFVRTDLRAHARDLVLDDVGGGPQRAAAADVDDEAAQQRLRPTWCA